MINSLRSEFGAHQSLRLTAAEKRENERADLRAVNHAYLDRIDKEKKQKFEKQVAKAFSKTVLVVISMIILMLLKRWVFGE